MQRRLFFPAALVVLALALAVVLGGVGSPSAGPEPAAAATPVPGGVAARTVSVSGEGTITVKPDLAHVVFGVVTTDADLSRAQSENATRMGAILDRLKALGIEEKDLQTVGYNISPQHGRDGGQVTGYVVSNGVRATVRDLGRLGATIDAASAAGANRVGGISFDLANKDDALRRAREAAVADARAKAEQYARLVSAQLGAPVTITENSNSGAAPQYQAPRAAAAAPGQPAPTTPIETGEGTVRLAVQITYEIR